MNYSAIFDAVFKVIKRVLKTMLKHIKKIYAFKQIPTINNYLYFDLNFKIFDSNK